MKKYFDISHLIAFILGGSFWSIVYIIMDIVAIAKVFVNGGFTLP